MVRDGLWVVVLTCQGPSWLYQELACCFVFWYEILKFVGAEVLFSYTSWVHFTHQWLLRTWCCSKYITSLGMATPTGGRELTSALVWPQAAYLHFGVKRVWSLGEYTQLGAKNETQTERGGTEKMLEQLIRGLNKSYWSINWYKILDLVCGMPNCQSLCLQRIPQSTDHRRLAWVRNWIAAVFENLSCIAARLIECIVAV